MQEAQVQVFEWQRCKELSKKSRITSRMFCAGNLEVGGKNFCDGDSGAAAIQDNKIVGIASFNLAKLCGRPDAPGVYTDVTKISDWISGYIRGSKDVLLF